MSFSTDTSLNSGQHFYNITSRADVDTAARGALAVITADGPVSSFPFFKNFCSIDVTISLQLKLQEYHFQHISEMKHIVSYDVTSSADVDTAARDALAVIMAEGSISWFPQP